MYNDADVILQLNWLGVDPDLGLHSVSFILGLHCLLGPAFQNTGDKNTIYSFWILADNI